MRCQPLCPRPALCQSPGSPLAQRLACRWPNAQPAAGPTPRLPLRQAPGLPLRQGPASHSARPRPAAAPTPGLPLHRPASAQPTAPPARPARHLAAHPTLRAHGSPRAPAPMRQVAPGCAKWRTRGVRVGPGGQSRALTRGGRHRTRSATGRLRTPLDAWTRPRSGDAPGCEGRHRTWSATGRLRTPLDASGRHRKLGGDRMPAGAVDGWRRPRSVMAPHARACLDARSRAEREAEIASSVGELERQIGVPVVHVGLLARVVEILLEASHPAFPTVDQIDVPDQALLSAPAQ